MTVAIPLALATAAMLAIGFAWGAAGVAIARRSTLSAGLAFGWGAALGPIGLCVVAVLARRRSRSVSRPAGEAR